MLYAALNKLFNFSGPVFSLHGAVLGINELIHAEPLDQRIWHVIGANETFARITAD